jgi:hypothetical protein
MRSCGFVVLVLPVLVFFGVTSLSAAPVPEYSVSVGKQSVRSAAGQRFAVLPLVCPQSLDCASLEEDYTEQLADSAKLSLVKPDAVRELIANADLGKLSELERRPILTEGLNVDGFVIVDILNAMVDRGAAAAGGDKWSDIRKHQQDTVTTVKIEVRLIAKDGSVLAQASGDAHLINSIKSLNSVAARIFEQTLAKLFSTEG